VFEQQRDLFQTFAQIKSVLNSRLLLFDVMLTGVSAPTLWKYKCTRLPDYTASQPVIQQSLYSPPYLFVFGATVPSGPGPPHLGGF